MAQPIGDAKLVQYLSEAYGKERELETALTAHIAMTVRTAAKAAALAKGPMYAVRGTGAAENDEDRMARFLAQQIPVRTRAVAAEEAPAAQRPSRDGSGR